MQLQTKFTILHGYFPLNVSKKVEINRNQYCVNIPGFFFFSKMTFSTHQTVQNLATSEIGIWSKASDRTDKSFNILIRHFAPWVGRTVVGGNVEGWDIEGNLIYFHTQR